MITIKNPHAHPLLRMLLGLVVKPKRDFFGELTDCSGFIKWFPRKEEKVIYPDIVLPPDNWQKPAFTPWTKECEGLLDPGDNTKNFEEVMELKAHWAEESRGIHKALLPQINPKNE